MADPFLWFPKLAADAKLQVIVGPAPAGPCLGIWRGTVLDWPGSVFMVGAPPKPGFGGCRPGKNRWEFAAFLEERVKAGGGLVSIVRTDTCKNWKAFLRNHLGSMVSVDFLTVPNLTFHVLYVFIVLSHHRRRVLPFIVLNEAHLHRLLKSYFEYYHRGRTHLGLDKDAPEPRPVQGPEEGKIVALPQVGGLHHRYERLAA